MEVLKSRSKSQRWLALVTALVLVPVAASCGDAAPVATSTLSTPVVASSPAATVPSGAPAARPTATATSSANAGPRVIETVTPSAEVVAQLAAVEEVVVRARGRGLARDVDRSFVTSAGMRALLDDALEDQQAIDDLRDEELLLRALGLIGPNVDLLEAYRGLLGSQVVGLYTPEDNALYVLANAPPGPLELVTYAHEFHHALQDQRFDLEAIDEATRGNRDASLAASTLIEGDATYTQTLYVQQALGLAGALGLLGSAGAVPPPNAPPVLLDLLQFPYLQGLNFTSTLARRGGVAAIDAAFARLPASTEQVLHADKYLAGEAPQAVTRAFSIPAGWTIEDEDVLGEYLLQRWLRDLGLSPQLASGAAAGWGGDRYAVVRGPSEPPALLAYLVWDSPNDVDEFTYALFSSGPAEGVQLRPFASGRAVALVRLDGGTLGLVAAADAATAEQLGGLLAAAR